MANSTSNGGAGQPGMSLGQEFLFSLYDQQQGRQQQDTGFDLEFSNGESFGDLYGGGGGGGDLSGNYGNQYSAYQQNAAQSNSIFSYNLENQQHPNYQQSHQQQHLPPHLDTSSLFHLQQQDHFSATTSPLWPASSTLQQYPHTLSANSASSSMPPALHAAPSATTASTNQLYMSSASVNNIGIGSRKPSNISDTNPAGSTGLGLTSNKNLSKHVSNVISHFTATKDGITKLLNEVEDFVHVVSAAGQVVYASPSVQKMLDQSPQDVMGSSVYELIHENDRETATKYISQSVTTNSEFIMYLRYMSLQGTVKLCEVKGKPYYTVTDPTNTNDVDSGASPAGQVMVILSARDYRSKGNQSFDSIVELQVETLQLKRRLEEELMKRGLDTASHPLLMGTDEGLAAVGGGGFGELGGNASFGFRTTTETVVASNNFSNEDLAGSAQFGGAIDDFTDAFLYTVRSSSSNTAGAPAVAANSVDVGNLDYIDPFTMLSSTLSSQQADLQDSFQNGKTAVAAAPPASILQSSLNTQGAAGGGRSGTPTIGNPEKEKKTRKRKVPMQDMFCLQCGTTQSPEWRAGPEGPKTLCNACGLAYYKKNKKLAQAEKKAAASAVEPGNL